MSELDQSIGNDYIADSIDILAELYEQRQQLNKTIAMLEAMEEHHNSDNDQGDHDW